MTAGIISKRLAGFQRPHATTSSELTVAYCITISVYSTIIISEDLGDSGLRAIDKNHVRLQHVQVRHLSAVRHRRKRQEETKGEF